MSKKKNPTSYQFLVNEPKNKNRDITKYLKENGENSESKLIRFLYNKLIIKNNIKS